ncbi:UDP-N-acetylmuramoyl-L-alanine--D-glutamate ligase [bacterium]|nr:UDP-N-acetylmuramoyl-L-alanine--D-glutamate ligase [bacterium]
MRAVVIGKGKSGCAAASFLERIGEEAILVDTKDAFPAGEFDLAVLSPGISKNHPYLENLSEKTELISEVELALRHCKGKVIAVTGTNGKSSLVSFLGAMLSAKVCGNIGIPACDVLPMVREGEYVVVELSSFQLELMFAKKIEMGILLEITKDHLDRYKNFESYKAAKYRLKDLVVDGGHFFIEKPSTSNDGLYFKGSVMDILKEVSKITGVSIMKGEALFKPLPHRLEEVAKRDGVTFINDSKATNVASTAYATHRIKGSKILLVGGADDKDQDFTVWNDSLPKDMKAIICFGACAKKIKKSLQSNFVVYTVNKMEEAIVQALSLMERGDTVLLSPGCASFDEFSKFEERGELFRRKVEK